MRGGVVPRRWYAGASPAIFFKQELPEIDQEFSRNNFFLNGKDSEYLFKTAIILFFYSNYQQLDSNYQQFFSLEFLK